jgi:hypothetical protein
MLQPSRTFRGVTPIFGQLSSTNCCPRALRSPLLNVNVSCRTPAIRRHVRSPADGRGGEAKGGLFKMSEYFEIPNTLKCRLVRLCS